MSLILKWLESLSIDLTITERCSRKISPKSTCTTCIDHCHVEALSLADGKVRCDVNKCDSCGKCITSCSVSAINGNVPNRAVKNGLLSYEPHFCPTVKELLIFRKRGLKGILIPNGWQDSQWENVIEEANELLGQLDMEPFFFQKLEETKDPAMTRRELFVSAKSRGQSLAKELAPATWRQNPNAWSIPFYYRDFQFFQVELDSEKCSLCESCFALCSQEVFVLCDSELLIDHQKCTNCKLCSDACPESAVTVLKKVGAKSESMFPVVKRKCKRCKDSYLSFGDDDGLCLVCSKIPSDWLMP